MLLSAGLVEAFLSHSTLPALLFLPIYGWYFRSYWKRRALKLFARVHLLEIVLFPLALFFSGVLFSLLVLLFLGGRDYGLPMVIGFIAGLLGIIIFPPVFLAVHGVLLFLLRRRGLFRSIGATELLRLSHLAIGMLLVILTSIHAAVDAYSARMRQEIRLGPPITFRPLPAPLTGFHAFLDLGFLRGKTVSSWNLHKGKQVLDLQRKRIGKKVILITLDNPSGAVLRLETRQKYPWVGEIAGPVYELPVKVGRALPWAVLRRASWLSGKNPGIRLEMEVHDPIDRLEVCWHFGGKLYLVTRRGRQIVLGGLYSKRGNEEYLCREPETIPETEGPLVGNVSLFLPMSREDFEALRKEGLAQTGFSPIALTILLRARPWGVPSPKGWPLEQRVETSLPFPR